MICQNILEAVGNTPMVRLNRMPEPGSAEILVKVEALNVGGSIKTRTALNMIEAAEREGLITILRHEDLSPQKKEWIRKTMQQEYADAKDHPEYQFFLRGTFPELFE